jgi:hypothetical protein
MMQFLRTRTFVRLVAAATVVTACSRSEQADTADSTTAATADTTASPAAAPTTPAASSSPANNTPASLTADDIDRWQKGMDGELEAVKKAGADFKAAKTANDSTSAMMAANEMSTRAAGAKAAGVDEERYQLIRTTLSSVVGQMAPIELTMDVSKLPAASVAELKKSREAGLAQATAELSPALVEALKPRAAALRKQDLTLTGERLKASGIGK